MTRAWQQVQQPSTMHSCKLMNVKNWKGVHPMHGCWGSEARQAFYRLAGQSTPILLHTLVLEILSPHLSCYASQELLHRGSQPPIVVSLHLAPTICWTDVVGALHQLRVVQGSQQIYTWNILMGIVSHLGANKTPQAIVRAGKVLWVLMDAITVFDKLTGGWATSNLTTWSYAEDGHRAITE